MVTLVRLVQLKNALVPMLVTLSGMMTLVRLLQSIECVIPDAGDAAPVNSSWNLNRSSGIGWIISNRHRRVVGIDRISIQAKRLSRSVA